MTVALVLAASALVPSGSRLFACHQMQCRGRYSSGVVMVEQIPRPDGNAIPIRSVVLGLATVSSVFGLASDRELAGLITRMGDPTLDVNYFNTLVDSFVLSYGTNYLLNTLGILRPDLSESSKKLTLNGMECPITLNIGREPGTWMPKEWAASGARLSLPTTIRFSDEIVDLGFPGEDALDANGDRYAKKLYCEGGSFVGAQGEVKVRASGGAWNMEPSGIPGANTLNFFIDIPEAAARNDVTLPQGRLFFSCACWESKEALPPGILDGGVDMPDGSKAGAVEGPGGVYVLNQGGVSIKRNDWRNLWGSLGDVMLILGRFSVQAAPARSM